MLTPEQTLSEVRVLGSVRLERASGRILVRGESVKLPWRSAEALRMLADARGAVVTKEQFLEQIWGQALMDDSNLAHCIRALRKAIDPAPNGESHIETVARIGYKLSVEVVDEGLAALPEAPVSAQPRRFLRHALILIPLALAAVTGVAALVRESERQRQSDELIYNGLWELRHNNSIGADRATELFQRAESLTPDKPLLLAARAEFIARRGKSDFGGAIEQARTAAKRDPDCTECQAIAGYVLMTRAWAWEEAGTYLSRAIASKSTVPAHLIWYGEWLAVQGRLDEALPHAKSAVRAMPQEPRAYSMLASVNYLRGDYKAAVEAGESATALSAKHLAAHYWKWRAFAMIGDDVGTIVARNYADTTFAGLPETERVALNARLLKLLREGGREAIARAWLKEVDEGSPLEVHRYNRAIWHAWIGEYDAALVELEAAVKSKPYHLVYVAVDPVFAPLHSNPRFQSVVEQVGLTVKR